MGRIGRLVILLAAFGGVSQAAAQAPSQPSASSVSSKAQVASRAAPPAPEPARVGRYDPRETFAPLTLPDPVNRYRSADGTPGPDYWQNSRRLRHLGPTRSRSPIRSPPARS